MCFVLRSKKSLNFGCVRCSITRFWIQREDDSIYFNIPHMWIGKFMVNGTGRCHGQICHHSTSFYMWYFSTWKILLMMEKFRKLRKIFRAFESYTKIEDGSFHPFNLRFFWWIFHWFRFNFLSIVWFIYVTFHHTTNHFVIPEKRKSFDIIRFSICNRELKVKWSMCWE